MALNGMLLSSVSDAHRLKYPKTLSVDFRDKKCLFTLTYNVNPGQDASLLRALFDRNSNGKLEGEEQERLTEYLERTAVMFLRVRINGELARLIQLESSMHRASSNVAASKAMGLQIRFSAEIPTLKEGGTLSLSISDRDKDDQKHVPTVVDVGKMWSVILSSQGEFHTAIRQISNIKLKLDQSLELKMRRGQKPSKDPEAG